MEVQNLENFEDNEVISWFEVVLHDALDNIFRYLNIYDLCQASKVCRSWHQAARIEKSKRGAQVLILQALEDLVATGFSDVRWADDEAERIDDFKLSLRIRPRLGLFFTDGKYPAHADCDSLTFEICRAHQWTQPELSYCVAVESLGVRVNGLPVTGANNLTAAALLPVRPGVDYSLAEVSSHLLRTTAATDSLLDDVTSKLFGPADDLPGHKQISYCFILFVYHYCEPTISSHHSDFLARLLDRLRARYEPGSYALWGGMISDVFAIALDRAAGNPRLCSTSFCALGISGRAVGSWSLALAAELTSSQLSSELDRFKARVSLGSSSLAFLSLPDSRLHDDRPLELFRQAFPSVTLLSIVNARDNAVVSIDSTCHESQQPMLHVNSYAYLIITFK